VFHYLTNMTKSESILFKANSIINEHIDEIKMTQKMSVNEEKVGDRETNELQIVNEVVWLYLNIIYK
jgi:cell fate (sporulation/competence/biofilm development) regulator YmcA (YheA/YmcA/DUF963 family)